MHVEDLLDNKTEVISWSYDITLLHPKYNSRWL